jgi:hypothetical protein
MAMGSEDARKNAESANLWMWNNKLRQCANVPHDDSTSSSTIDVMRRIPRTGFCCGQDMGMTVAVDGGGMMMARLLAN